MPPTKDLRVCVEDALAARLSALTYGDPATDVFSVVYAGWPEHEKTRDLAEGPVASVVVIGAPKTRLTAAEVESVTDVDVEQPDPDPPLPTSAVVYNVGEWTATVQITMWCEHKAQAEETARDVRELLLGTPPHETGLMVTLTDYYGANAVLLDDFIERPPQERTDLEKHSWVSAVTVDVFTHVLYEVTHTRSDVIHLETTTDVMGLDSTSAVVTTTFEAD